MKYRISIILAIVWILSWDLNHWKGPSGNRESLSTVTQAVAAVNAECPSNKSPVGQVTQLEGEVSFHRFSESDQPLTSSIILCSGDTIKTQSTARGIISCFAENEEYGLLPEMKYSVTIFCPVARICDKTEDVCGRGSDLIKVSNIPYIISPRYTNLLNKQPTIRWKAVSGATRYILSIEESGMGKIWSEEIKGDKTQIIYPGNPSLKAGTGYTLIFEAVVGNENSIVSEKVEFSILDEKSADFIDSYRLPSNQISKIPAQVYVYEANYLSKESLPSNLYDNAIDLLEAFVKDGNESTLAYRKLGDLYWKVALIADAEESYKKAAALAFATTNLKSEALAEGRLGELYCQMKAIAQSRNNDKSAMSFYELSLQKFQKAKELYEQSGDLELAKKFGASEYCKDPSISEQK